MLLQVGALRGEQDPNIAVEWRDAWRLAQVAHRSVAILVCWQARGQLAVELVRVGSLGSAGAACLVLQWHVVSMHLRLAQCEIQALHALKEEEDVRDVARCHRLRRDPLSSSQLLLQESVLLSKFLVGLTILEDVEGEVKVLPDFIRLDATLQAHHGAILIFWIVEQLEDFVAVVSCACDVADQMREHDAIHQVLRDPGHQDQEGIIKRVDPVYHRVLFIFIQARWPHTLFLRMLRSRLPWLLIFILMPFVLEIVALVRSIEELASCSTVSRASRSICGSSHMLAFVAGIGLSHRLVHLIVEEVDPLYAVVVPLAVSLGLHTAHEGLGCCFSHGLVDRGGLRRLEEHLLALRALRLIESLRLVVLRLRVERLRVGSLLILLRKSLQIRQFALHGVCKLVLLVVSYRALEGAACSCVERVSRMELRLVDGVYHDLVALEVLSVRRKI